MKHHPAVYDVVATGTPNERWGEQVTAVVALRPGMQPTDDELRDTAADQVARYEVAQGVRLRRQHSALRQWQAGLSLGKGNGDATVIVGATHASPLEGQMRIGTSG